MSHVSLVWISATYTHHGKRQTTMSNLAIFLCSVFIASAVNASYVSDALVSAEATVDGLIVATINATKQKFNDTKSKAAEDIAKLEAAAKSALEKAFQQIKSALEQAEVEIGKLARKDNGSEISDCNKFESHLIRTGFAAYVNMNGCIDDKFATGSGYLRNITTLSEKVLANLTSIREEARHCRDNVNGNVDGSTDDIDTTVAAIKCIDMAGFKAMWVETKVVPSLTTEITNITNSLATLQPSLAYCSTINEFDTFYLESSTIVERTKQCIDQLRYEAHPGIVEVMTEKASSSETTPYIKNAST